MGVVFVVELLDPEPELPDPVLEPVPLPLLGWVIGVPVGETVGFPWVLSAAKAVKEQLEISIIKTPMTKKRILFFVFTL